MSAADRHHLRLGVLTLLAVLGIAVFVIGGFFGRLTTPSEEHEVTAMFASTAQLTKGDQVRVDGVRVGTVRKVRLRDGLAEVRMSLRDNAPDLYRDARATARWRTLLGGSFIVDLDPGTATAGKLVGDRITQEATATQVEVDEVLGVLRGPTRRGLRVLLAEAPEALADPTQPAGALRAVGDAGPNLERAVRAVRGDDGDVRRLVASASRVTAALDAPVEPVREIVAGAARTAGAAARQETALRRTIARTASVLPEATATLDRLRPTLARADELVERLRPQAGRVAPAVDALRPVLARAATLLDTADPTLRALRPAIAQLGSAARTATPLLRDLEPALRKLDESILPNLEEIDPIDGLPTWKMIGPTISALNAAMSQFDANGTFFRFPALGGDRAVDTMPCRTALADPEATALISCSSIQQALQDFSKLPPLRRRGG